MRLVEEFPGRRDKILSRDEYRAFVEARDEADCRMRRERMFTLANELVEGSRQLQPADLRNRSDGNFAVDATFVPLSGKAGNPSPGNLDVKRRSVNYDGNWYRREGSHGAVTHADAEALNKSSGTKDHKGTDVSKLMWGIEIEIARGTANHHDTTDQFPLLTHAISFHRPGELVGEGLRIAQSLRDRGHKANFFIADRAYNNGLYHQYAAPIRLLGYKHVFSYKDADLEVQGHDPRGFVQVGGAWYLDNLPEVLRKADKVINKARAVCKSDLFRIRNSNAPVDVIAKECARVKKVSATAEQIYTQQQARREQYRRLAKGIMATDWSRRYLIPTDSPRYADWKSKEGSHQGQTVMFKRPVGKEAAAPNARGLKHEQHFVWGSEEWTRVYGMRNGVESVNRNLKRSQYEDMAEPDKRAVRGNTFTYLIASLATVVENLRQIISFYKRRLATVPLTAKNKDIPGVFWQSEVLPPISEAGNPPPG
jgi:hypothetical protein